MEIGENTGSSASTSTSGSSSHSPGHLSVKRRAVATTPKNRVRTEIGVGERVQLTAHGQTGTVSWTVAGASKVKPKSGTSVTLTAHKRAETVTVTATDSCGCKAEVEFAVKEPTAVIMERTGNVWHTHNIPSVGIRTNIYIQPIGVSFENIEICEDDCAAQVTGYFKGTALDGVHHAGHGAGTWVSVGAQVAHKGSKVNGQDTAQSGHCHFGLPYRAGRFHWPIPWRFRVSGGGGKRFTVAHQRFTINAAGDMTVSKAGASGNAAYGAPSSSY